MLKKDRTSLKTETKLMDTMREITKMTSEIINNEKRVPRRKRSFYQANLLNRVIIIYTDIKTANDIFPDCLRNAELRYKKINEIIENFKYVISVADLFPQLLSLSLNNNKWIGRYTNLLNKANKMVVKWGKTTYKKIEEFEKK